MNKDSQRTSLLVDDSRAVRSYQPYTHTNNYAPPDTGGYYEREGFPLTTYGSLPKDTKIYVPNSWWTWAFVVIVVLQAIIGLGLEGYVFAEFQIGLQNGATNSTESKSVPCYLSLYIFGFVYQLVLAYDALRLKNTIQIIGLCLYNVGLLIEAAVQIDQIHDAVIALQFPANGGPQQIDPSFWPNVHPFIVAVPCVIALGTLLMMYASWKLYGEFAWSIYTQLSADVQLKRRFLTYQIYIALLKFDFFFFLAFTIQFLVVVVHTNDFELYITIIALPVTVALLFLAAFWVRRESRWGMGVIIVFYFAGLAYFIFKLVRMYDSSPDRIQDYLPARRSLTTFAIITVLLLVVTIVYAFMCTFNFDKGLKQHVASKSRRTKDEEDIYNGTQSGTTVNNANNFALASPGPSRREID